MTVNLPEELEARLSPRSAALHLAIGLFVTEEATLGQAAEVAGLPRADFLRKLGKRRIPIHYGPDELEQDLRGIEQIVSKCPPGYTATSDAMGSRESQFS